MTNWLKTLVAAVRRRPTLALDALKYTVAALTAAGVAVDPRWLAAGAAALVALTAWSDLVAEGQKREALETTPTAPSDPS